MWDGILRKSAELHDMVIFKARSKECEEGTSWIFEIKLFSAEETTVAVQWLQRTAGNLM